ncbi:MAG: hypothetical protein AAF485_04825 [Chloroflexota bacterium]
MSYIPINVGGVKISNHPHLPGYKKHRLSLLLRIFLTAAALLLLAMPAGHLFFLVISLLSDPWLLMDTVVFLLTMVSRSCMFFIIFGGFYFLYLAHRVWIITSADGLEIQSVGFKASTSWDNIEKIGQYRLGEALYLNQPFLIEGNKTVATLNGFNSEKLVFPLGRAKRWRNRELGKEIERYAPHLFT